MLKDKDSQGNEMTKYVYIVQVHPVENGEPNLYKVKDEFEFVGKQIALDYVEWLNATLKDEFRAVYYGCVNDETGELV